MLTATSKAHSTGLARRKRLQVRIDSIWPTIKAIRAQMLAVFLEEN